MLFQLLKAGAVMGLVQNALAASSTCSQVAVLHPSIPIEYPSSPEYAASQDDYWSTGSRAVEPGCILTPTSTEQVSQIVRVLLSSDEAFAIKSGGHNPNPNFSSVAGGPLISTRRLNEVLLDRATGKVQIGPGNRWDDVSAALDGTGYSVVGGRLGNVGIGGYMLGGGLSFMSTQHGWAANSVLQYTLVLANGTVLGVNGNNYPDIFLALKGGGNNFGIVTSYLVQAYSQGQVWGGNLIYNADSETTPQLLAAVRDFSDDYPDDKAAIILTAERTFATLVHIWVLFLYYNGSTPPLGVFDRFFAVSHLVDTTKARSFNDLVTANNWAVVKGSVYIIGAETTPVPSRSHGAEVLGGYYDTWVNVSNQAALVPGSVGSLAFQPMPRRIARIAKQKGGDMIDLDEDVNRIMFQLVYSFSFDSDYEKMDLIMQNTYNGLNGARKNFEKHGKVAAGSYVPLFMNDAFHRQDYFRRLRSGRRELAARVRDQVDPIGFWRDRTGGFKI